MQRAIPLLTAYNILVAPGDRNGCEVWSEAFSTPRLAARKSTRSIDELKPPDA